MSKRGRVLVTGSNRGIGLEFVRQYLVAGYEVIATCRNPADAADLRALDGRLRVAQLDVASEPDLETLREEVGDAPIDLLICNAAVFGGEHGRFGDVMWDDWRAVLETNLLGTLRAATALWDNVLRSDERKIVFLSSRAGLPREARPRMSYIYASSKAALNAAVRCFALDAVEHGVTVALVNPGHVKTGIGGKRAPMEPAESVTQMRKVIAALTPIEAGRFWHFDGTELKL